MEVFKENIVYMNKKAMEKESGFTLIELVIVIAIIGILAAIAIPAFSSYKIKGYNAQAESALRNAQTAATAFYAENISSTAIDNAALIAAGYNDTAGVTLTLGTPTSEETLTMEAVHDDGTKVYSIASIDSPIVEADKP